MRGVIGLELGEESQEKQNQLYRTEFCLSFLGLGVLYDSQNSQPSVAALSKAYGMRTFYEQMKRTETKGRNINT